MTVFLNRIFALFVGYLIIHFRGERVERFINLCLQSGIPIWDIYTTKNGTVVGKTSIEGFKQMRPVARRSGVRVRILKRRGLPFILSRLWQRTAFVCGALLFITSLYILGSIVWFVEVRGNEQVATSTILQAAAELGLKPGVWRKRLIAGQLSRSLAIKVPELSWVGVEVKGSCAVIEVVEKKIVVVEPKPIGHVIASKAGVIQKIVASTGKSMVKVGDNVEQGQILISGAFTVDDDAEIRYVHAEGIAEASVWYEASATSARERLARRRTGRTATSEMLVFGDKEIVIAGPQQPPFPLYEVDCQSLPLLWRSLGAPVEHMRRTYFEVEEEWEQVSLEVAQAEAAELAHALAVMQLPSDATMLASSFETQILSDNNTVQVRAIIEAIEPIGEFMPLIEE